MGERGVVEPPAGETPYDAIAMSEGLLLEVMKSHQTIPPGAGDVRAAILGRARETMVEGTFRLPSAIRQPAPRSVSELMEESSIRSSMFRPRQVRSSGGKTCVSSRKTGDPFPQECRPETS